MTLYGDLDISVISELPSGRKSVTTLWVRSDERKEIYHFIESLLVSGSQGYVICPLIDENRELSPRGVLAVYQELAQIFARYPVGILHGRMKSDEKRKIMADFKEKKLRLLVSTVVIEVGVDIPGANFMIIENADKFGLAQLHQLRGRIGRRNQESYCILFSEGPSEESKERLAAFEKMHSGFDIAEEDLRQRGAGELVGEKQHGFLKLRIGDLAKDIQILEKAKVEASGLVEQDPLLERLEHRLLRRRVERRFQLLDERITVLAS